MRIELMTFLFFLIIHACNAQDGYISIAENGEAKLNILIPENPTEVQEFAANELANYLFKISGATFKIQFGLNQENSNYFRFSPEKNGETDYYKISGKSGDIILSASSDRNLLYAVYDILEQVGCKWLAPEFDFYNGNAEFIPEKSNVTYHFINNYIQKPVFNYRKLDIGEGRSIDTKTLYRIIEWMPKVRLNTLMFPMNQNNKNKTVWEDYNYLVPEIVKRGLYLEVGQHGYQNFLNADMEDGKLFKLHPEWFGKSPDCKPDKSAGAVFNTSNSEAVSFFYSKFLEYLNRNPTIDVFDLWPPDFAHWNYCSSEFTDSPSILQARFSERIMSKVIESGKDMKLEIIAFEKTLNPIEIDKNIIVDICPINQCFEFQLNDSQSKQNFTYCEAIRNWRKIHQGDLGIYTYYRKYAWNSLPNIIPNYMQNDLIWFSNVPVQGISCYAEPGDWITYELNHFILAKLEWDPAVNVDSLIIEFCKTRFGRHWEIGKLVFKTFENSVRFYGNIKNSKLKSAEAIHVALVKLYELKDLLEIAIADSELKELKNFENLLLLVKYACLDMEIMELKASDLPIEILYKKIEELHSFLFSNQTKGTIVYSKNTDIEHLIKKYKITNQ